MYNQIKVEFIRLSKSLFFYLTIIAFVILGAMHSYKIVFIDKLYFAGGEAFSSAICDTSLIFL